MAITYAVISVLILTVWIIIVASNTSKMPEEHLGNWCQYHEGLSLSGKEFYVRLKEKLKQREVPNVWFNEVSFAERSIMSARRKYLRIRYREFLMDFTCAPYGKGTYFSWWIGKERGLLEKLMSGAPFIGARLKKMFYPTTYHHIDTASMFKASVHQSILDVVDGYVKEHGVRLFDATERKNDLFAFKGVLKQ